MTTASHSLGEILRLRQIAEQNDALLKLQREAEAQDAKALEDLRKVQAFFYQAKEAFSNAILQNQPMPRIVLGHGKNTEVYSLLQCYRWNDPRQVISQPTHPYHPVWEDFAKWAYVNDLKPSLVYEHDGVGIDSWHVLKIDHAL